MAYEKQEQDRKGALKLSFISSFNHVALKCFCLPKLRVARQGTNANRSSGDKSVKAFSTTANKVSHFLLVHSKDEELFLEVTRIVADRVRLLFIMAQWYGLRL